MKVESKFNIKESVYFLYNNEVLNLYIGRIVFPTIKVVSVNQIKNGDWVANTKSNCIKYAFLLYYDNSVYLTDSINESIIYIEEYRIFKTKEELLKSL